VTPEVGERCDHDRPRDKSGGIRFPACRFRSAVEEPGRCAASVSSVSVRQLFPLSPNASDVDLVAAYQPEVERWRLAHPERGAVRPWTTVNMVASVDGSMTLTGRSGGLSDEVDREIFHVLRSMADVILVGAGTVRAERYGPARIAPGLAGLRDVRGQDPLPRIVVVSASGRFDPDLPLFDPEVVGDGPPPIIVTCAAHEENVQLLGSRAEALVAGDTTVDLELALTMLRERGVQIVVSEGGPTLNASMVERGLLDEICLTVSPLTVGGDAGRIIQGHRELPTPIPMELAHILELDGALYTRWRFSHPTT
jgi:riboflavin biosynthesis pyrimidine reductase